MQKKRIAAVAAAGTMLVGAPVAIIASPASADVERHGHCGTGHYEFSVDREHRGFEVDFGLEDVTPGSTWRVRLYHEGKRVKSTTRYADHEGELDVETWRRNTKGKDRFKAVAHRLDGSGKCRTKITVR